MKYMGSKRKMLNGMLGEIIDDKIKNANRFVDLFCGSGSVAWYVAKKYDKKVISVDLQKYSKIISQSILSRIEPINVEKYWSLWNKKYQGNLKKTKLLKIAKNAFNEDISIWSKNSKSVCEKYDGGIIWKSYGGYYYSAEQALKLDILMNSIPFNSVKEKVAITSIIFAASQCSGSPGHTAQPFKANKTAGKFLKEYWLKDPLYFAEKYFKEIGLEYSKVKGKSYTSDALNFKHIEDGDLIFLDPPYTGVQYSRFYHVLETIARKKVGKVFGTGRYSPIEERPDSVFSKRKTSKGQFEKLIKKLSEKDTTLIITYPDRECSNGLNGRDVIKISKKYFKKSKKKLVSTNFSTLGGNNVKRDSRLLTNEMILILNN
ncbi:hypothetical protein C0585_05245 [Candidatus Woesearchaeota archaeon]|nr:MAG: hypothetical protein C0585_05245 [Candidatus Woesearchaeota archaeon]